jgi:hypothetical protein
MMFRQLQGSARHNNHLAGRIWLRLRLQFFHGPASRIESKDCELVGGAR